MPPITALLHTANDALRLGRTLETLLPCEEILVVNHGSQDATVRIAREYGARILPFHAAANPGHYLQSARHDWILCLDPRESLTEGLEASLYEWRSEARSETANSAFSVFVREETADGWLVLPAPQTRLIPRKWNRCRGYLPAEDPSTYRAALPLEGELLRFILP
jgi:glycosyltransferase involved in cell wall biosynthesis